MGDCLGGKVEGIGGADGMSWEGQERWEREEREGKGQKMRIGGWWVLAREEGQLGGMDVGIDRVDVEIGSR